MRKIGLDFRGSHFENDTEGSITVICKGRGITIYFWAAGWKQLLIFIDIAHLYHNVRLELLASFPLLVRLKYNGIVTHDKWPLLDTLNSVPISSFSIASPVLSSCIKDMQWVFNMIILNDGAGSRDLIPSSFSCHLSFPLVNKEYGLHIFSHKERLDKNGLFSMGHWKLRENLIDVYKIMTYINRVNGKW